MPIWNPKFETMPRPELTQLQARRLRQVAERVYRDVPFYRRQFDAAGVIPEDITSLADLRRLPFTTKQDMREQYPYGLFSLPLEKVERIHASSGTTGRPVVAGYSRADLQVWGEVMARVLSSAGVTACDVVHVAHGYGLFTGAHGFEAGALTIGATVVPASGGLSKRQIMLLEDFRATALVCTPSYALVLAETADELGVDVKRRLKVRVGMFGAEPWTREMRVEIEARLNLEAFDSYGLTELIGPGVAIECDRHDGLHIFEDHFLPEIIDPESGEPRPYGEPGELVLTSLTKEAMPVIRYRTRDRSRLWPERCACGRTMVRMEKVSGRTDDMLIVRGVNVFPSAIESALLKVDGLHPHYQIWIDRPRDLLDELEVWVEADERFFDPHNGYLLEKLRVDTRRELQETLGIGVVVKLTKPYSIERSLGKAKRVIDKRELFQATE
jgi:phenylacetate-CoA ligase